MAAYIGFQPSDFYNTTLYTGTGSSNAITGVGFQPDFVWTKNRDSTDNNNLFDAVRGATKYITSNLTSAEGTTAESLKSFDADGFTVGTWGDTNGNTEDYVSWNWKMGTTSGIAGSPSITPTSYSFSATAGQSIIKYAGNGVAGATLPHGLGVAPELILVKNIDETMAWVTYHKPLGNTKYMVLDTNGAAATSTTRWNDTTPGATLFTIGDTDKLNTNTINYVAYCFTPKQGYSKFGRYTGNANADGTFVYTGFRPAFLIIKSIGANAWYQFDDKRLGYNEANSAFEADSSYAETSPSTYLIDFLSNGFKPRHLSAAFNASGQEYVYIAFAEFPFVSSNSIPTTAR